MTERKVLFKIAAGSQTVSYMNALDYFEDWPEKSDQDCSVPWSNPNIISSTIARYEVERESLSRKTNWHGQLEADLQFDLWTAGMLSYFTTQIFVAATYATVTVQMENELYVVTTYRFTAQKPRAGEQLKGIPGGYQVSLRLRGGVIIT